MGSRFGMMAQPSGVLAGQALPNVPGPINHPPGGTSRGNSGGAASSTVGPSSGDHRGAEHRGGAVNRNRAVSMCTAAGGGGGTSRRGLSLGMLQYGGGGAGAGGGAAASSPNSDDSTPGDETPLSRAFHASSLPVHLFSYRDIKCPVCSKVVRQDDVECHLVMCLTRPRISYNEDVLSEDKDECVICFEDLRQGDTIARLPCLCIYHKGCIDQWFKVNRSCPEHPD